jgi:hypothetical protein
MEWFRMDISGIGSFAASVSTLKSSQASTEAQVLLSKKQSSQTEQVAKTIIESAGSSPPVQKPGQGNLIAVA